MEKRQKPFIILFFLLFSTNSKIKGVFKSNLLFHLFLSLQETTVISIIHIFLKNDLFQHKKQSNKKKSSNKNSLKKKNQNLHTTSHE